jgi:hypothetical protein
MNPPMPRWHECFAAPGVRVQGVPVESCLRIRHAHTRGCERGGHALIADARVRHGEGTRARSRDPRDHPELERSTFCCRSSHEKKRLGHCGDIRGRRRKPANVPVGNPLAAILRGWSRSQVRGSGRPAARGPRQRGCDCAARESLRDDLAMSLLDGTGLCVTRSVRRRVHGYVRLDSRRRRGLARCTGVRL